MAGGKEERGGIVLLSPLQRLDRRERQKCFTKFARIAVLTLDPSEKCDCQQEKRSEPDKAAERRKEEEKEHGKIQRNRA